MQVGRNYVQTNRQTGDAPGEHYRSGHKQTYREPVYQICLSHSVVTKQQHFESVVWIPVSGIIYLSVVITYY